MGKYFEETYPLKLVAGNVYKTMYTHEGSDVLLCRYTNCLGPFPVPLEGHNDPTTCQALGENADVTTI